MIDPARRRITSEEFAEYSRLAYDTAPRLTSLLKSVEAHFNDSCRDGKGICPNNALHERIKDALKVIAK